MKPIRFEEQTCTYIRPEEFEGKGGCLGVYMDGKQCVSCWRLSFLERIKALIHGKVWLSIAREEQPPVWLECDKPIFEKE